MKAHVSPAQASVAAWKRFAPGCDQASFWARTISPRTTSFFVIHGNHFTSPASDGYKEKQPELIQFSPISADSARLTPNWSCCSLPGVGFLPGLRKRGLSHSSSSLLLLPTPLLLASRAEYFCLTSYFSPTLKLHLLPEKVVFGVINHF